MLLFRIVWPFMAVIAIVFCMSIVLSLKETEINQSINETLHHFNKLIFVFKPLQIAASHCNYVYNATFVF